MPRGRIGTIGFWQLVEDLERSGRSAYQLSDHDTQHDLLTRDLKILEKVGISCQLKIENAGEVEVIINNRLSEEQKRKLHYISLDVFLSLIREKEQSISVQAGLLQLLEKRLQVRIHQALGEHHFEGEEHPVFGLETFRGIKSVNVLRLESAIKKKKVFEFILKEEDEGKEKKIYGRVHRLFFFKGRLQCVLEGTPHHILELIEVERIKFVREAEHSLSAGEGKISYLEVDQFISGLRGIDETEIRVVLKLLNPDLDLRPYFHFLKDPFATMTSRGEKIWAASVELCPDFFDWLYGVRENIQILDPIDLQESFDNYCKSKQEGDDRLKNQVS
jgi:hypothetical protein